MRRPMTSAQLIEFAMAVAKSALTHRSIRRPGPERPQHCDALDLAVVANVFDQRSCSRMQIYLSYRNLVLRGDTK